MGALYIIGCVVAALLLAGWLLSEGDTVSSYGRSRGLANMFTLLLVLVMLALIAGGRIAVFAGCVCIVLKFLAVEPVASWTWMQACLPLLGGFVAIIVGLIIKEGIKE